MAKDRLYLLKPDFSEDGEGPYFCSSCAMVEGMLSFFPALRDRVEVNYVDFQRPRPKIVAVLGQEHQSAPVLVLGDESEAIVTVQQAGGNRFIDNEYLICQYLAQAYGLSKPHGQVQPIVA